MITAQESPTAVKHYQEGVSFAEWWISTGGTLYVQASPESWSEAKCNGFFDRIRDERIAKNLK